MGGAPIETLTVVPVQDRAFGALAEGEVDSPGHPRNEGDHGRLVALADDAQRPVPSVEAEVLGVGRTGLAHSQAVEPKERGEGGLVRS